MSTGYSSGMRKHCITILNRTAAESGDFGVDGDGIDWAEAATVHAAIDWAKGMRALNAGSVDAYAVIIVRMDWNNIITMRSRISWNGDMYQILPETFHPDKQANTIQFNAQVIVE
ncbi:MAG: head-tail adaptor protein [Bacteroidaceae bacterium]|nr:head-tail adaptor protein [Bacteroidaceae bacterium]